MSSQESTDTGKCAVDASINETIAHLQLETAALQQTIKTLQEAHKTQSGGGYWWLVFIVVYIVGQVFFSGDE